ncbi:hypothetical protein HID58_014402, partial [Brassica napus]
TNPTLTEQNARDVESMRKTALDMIHLMNENFVLLISQLTHTSKKTNSMLFFSAMELPSQRWNITCLFCIAEHTSLKLSKLSFNFQHRMQKPFVQLFAQLASGLIASSACELLSSLTSAIDDSNTGTEEETEHEEQTL